MKIKRLSLAVIGVLFFPVVSGAQPPNFKAEETTFTEAQQHFEQEKGIYRYWVNEAANTLDDPDTPDIDESQWYKDEVQAQQDYDDRRVGMDVEQGRFYEGTQSITTRQSEQCPEEQTCKQKIAMLETLAYKQEIDCESGKYTGAAMARCMEIVQSYKDRAAEISQTCTTYPDGTAKEQCQQMVATMEQQLQTTAAGYMGVQAENDTNRPQVSYEIPYPDESGSLPFAYTFNSHEVLQKEIREVGTRNMQDEYNHYINNEEDIQAYYRRNYSNTPY